MVLDILSAWRADDSIAFRTEEPAKAFSLLQVGNICLYVYQSISMRFFFFFSSKRCLTCVHHWKVCKLHKSTVVQYFVGTVISMSCLITVTFKPICSCPTRQSPGKDRPVGQLEAIQLLTQNHQIFPEIRSPLYFRLCERIQSCTVWGIRTHKLHPLPDKLSD